MSLLPSATEILFALGAGDDIVGVTFECDLPVGAGVRPVVTTSSLPAGLPPGEIDATVRELLAAGKELYRLDTAQLALLQPDLIVTQDLCAVCAVDVGTVSEALAHLGSTADVLTTRPSRLTEVLTSITDIGAAVGRGRAAEQLVDELEQRLRSVHAAVAGGDRPRVLLLEWTDPPYTAGHWVPDLVTAAGGENALGTAGGRSAPATWDEVRASRPEVVVVAPCGYGLADATAQADQLVAGGVLPETAKVWAIDADAVVVRPGPRLVDGVEALASVLHPGTVPARPDLVAPVSAAGPALSW